MSRATLASRHLVALGLLLLALLPSTAPAEEPQPGKLLRHVVLFQFKAEVTEKQVAEVQEAFAALPGKIDAIEDFEWGTDVSVESKAQGFTHCFLVTFRDEAGRATYLPHPAHQEFVKLVGPRVEKVLVFDYWTGP